MLRSPAASSSLRRVIAASSSGYRRPRRVVVGHALSSSRHHYFSTESASTAGNTNTNNTRKRRLPDDGVKLSHFLGSSSDDENEDENDNPGPIPMPANLLLQNQILNVEEEEIRTLKFHLKTYGCQMNVNDSDIVRSVLLNHESNNIRFEETHHELDADVLLTNTCAIRENAEAKVWNRLRELRANDRKFPLEKVRKEGVEAVVANYSNRRSNRQKKDKERQKRIIGVLGCMAERLKEDMFKHGTADLIVGPDAFRDIPRLIASLSGTAAEDNAVNVQLSLDETYADITPIRANVQDVSAFVSVMRGCNNMCSYCVVPFTRGRERSREMESIVAEAKQLYETQGVKEIVLLGQNVNSYHDRSEAARLARPAPEGLTKKEERGFGYSTSNDGFSNLFNLRGGAGYYFADLVEAVSDLSPELRVRFTSPHPKDYPPELLTLMAERPNVCNQLHMPAQSGSTTVLERMRRGYSREAYLQLIDDVRSTIPDVAISSDFISGFCGETQEEHEDTLSLMELVAYDQAYMFAYSMRGKTHAHRTMVDDVPEDVKLQRLNEVINTFRRKVQERNDETEVGRIRLVLVEGESKKSREGHRAFSGRTDQNKRIVFPVECNDYGFGENNNGLVGQCWSENDIHQLVQRVKNDEALSDLPTTRVPLRSGDYAAVLVTEARGHTLKGQALWRSSMTGFHQSSSAQTLQKIDAFAKLYPLKVGGVEI